MENINITNADINENIKSDFIMKCINLNKYYSGKAALYNVNIDFEKGKVIGLLGPNGSGKTTLIKIAAGILTPSSGTVLIENMTPGIHTKKILSYLPEKTYLNEWMKVKDILKFFSDFYKDFNINKAFDMINRLGINLNQNLKTMSKGTKEKIQLILVMSRDAKVYFLDEPIAGVDPAARDYILNTIVSNYNKNSTVIISTHLIVDIEKYLDEVVFICNGQIKLKKTVDEIREETGKSVDSLFREVFRC